MGEPPRIEGTSSDDEPPDDHHHYGGEHHPYSLIDRLGERLEHELEADWDGRDPGFISDWVVPVLDTVLRYFDPVVQGFEHLPAEGAYLVVGNHSGGIYMPDYWAFLREWFRRRGPDEPIYSLGFDFLFSIPGFGSLARKIGSVPASQAHAAQVLQAGIPVMVYPGGDEEDYRPWTERHQVDLHGRTGFIELALRQRVPIVPLVAHGSHDVIIVLTRGERLARGLGLDRLRINIMPIVLGPPWGIAPVQLPTWPLPAKVTARVCAPISWPDLGPEAADDPATVQACFDEVLHSMQANLDDLVADLPHPVLTRLGTAIGLDRLRR